MTQTFADAYRAHVTGMDAKDRSASTKAFAYMAWDTLRRRGVVSGNLKHLETVAYFPSFTDRFSTAELLAFRPVIRPAKRA